MKRKNYLFKLIPILVIVAMILAVFATGGVAAEGSTTCAGPFPSITTLPYNDTGDTSNATTDNIPEYPGSGLEAFLYANDLVYEITLGTGNSVAFTAPGTAGVTDIAIFLVSTCNDGSTWVAHSQDSIDDANPEVIAEASYPAGTYYLLVDSYASDPGYPKYGAYSLEITGSLGEVAAFPVLM